MTNKKYRLKRRKNKIMKIILSGLLAFSLTGCEAKDDSSLEEIVLENSPRHIVMPEERFQEIDNSIIIGFNNLLQPFSDLIYATNFDGFEINDEIIEQVRSFAEFAIGFKTNRSNIDGYFYYNLSEDGALIVDGLINDVLNSAIEIDSELECYLNEFKPKEKTSLEKEHIEQFHNNIKGAIQNIEIKKEFHNDEIENTGNAQNENDVAQISEYYNISESRQGAYTIDVNGTLLNWFYSNEAPRENCAVMVGSGSTTDELGSYFIGHNPGPFNCVYNLNYGDPVTVYDENENSRTYSVYDIFEVSQDSYFEDVVDRAMPGGETIAMQTCTGRNDNMVRILVAK